jgi:hypothetical protein
MQLNGLAAIWIQTMIHDWQDHAVSKSTTTVDGGGAAHCCPLARFKIHNTHDFAPAGSNGGSAYLNTRTGWWCGACAPNANVWSSIARMCWCK